MPQEPENPLAAYISISNPVITVAHVEVIDGAGAAPIADQTTSTRAVYETFVPNRPPMPFLLSRRASMLAEAWSSVLETRAGLAARAGKSLWTAAFKKEMAFERAFAAAGGLLRRICL